MTKNIVLIAAVGGLVVVGIIGLVVAASVFDPKNADLKKAPGYDLVYPGGDILSTNTSKSVLGGGASIDRNYGIKTADEEVRSYFNKELTALGYQRTSEISDVYTKGPLRFQFFFAPTGTRMAGRTWTDSGYRVLLSTRLDNIPR